MIVRESSYWEDKNKKDLGLVKSMEGWFILHLLPPNQDGSQP